MRKMMSLVAVLACAACGNDTDALITEVDPEPTAFYQVTLSPLARPGAGGSVNITQFGSYFEANATFSGLLPNTFHQWKTYFGTCEAKLREMQIGATSNPPAYANFTTDASGAGTAKATVFGRFKPDSSYNVRVFTTPQVTPVSPDTVHHACGMVTPKPS